MNIKPQLLLWVLGNKKEEPALNNCELLWTVAQYATSSLLMLFRLANKMVEGKPAMIAASTLF